MSSFPAIIPPGNLKSLLLGVGPLPVLKIANETSFQLTDPVSVI